MLIRIDKSDKSLPLLNELEIVAAMFSSGVADEGLGFEIIGWTFCKSVETYFDLVAFGCNVEVGYFELNSTAKMYMCWSPRLKKVRLSADKQRLDAQLSSIRATSIKPLGGDV